MSRSFVSILIALLLICCASCHRSESPATERRNRQELALNIFTEPPTLEPGFLEDAFSCFMQRLFFEGLTRPNHNNTYELAVAKDVHISEDGRVYTFQLRDTTWTNGDPVTADDFVYAWKRLLNPLSPSPMAHHLYLIKGAKEAKMGRASLDDVEVRAIDPHTLRVKLINPAPYFLEVLQSPPFLPVNARIVEKNPNWAAEASESFVGNGPFRLTEWKHFSRIVVEKNSNYWDATQVKLSKIIMLMVEHGETEVALFDHGAIDWAGSPVSKPLPPECLANLRASDRIEIAPKLGTYCYLFNTAKAPFHSVKMRQALALALNPNEIVEHILKGGEQPAYSLLSPTLSLMKNPTQPKQDIDKARKLFNEALTELGLTRQQLPPIVLAYCNVETQRTIAQAAQNSWKQAFGIDVGLESQEWKAFVGRVIRRDFHIAGLGLIVNYSDPQAFLTRFSNEEGSNNYAEWHNPHYNRLLEEASVTSDARRRAQVLKEAEQLLMQEVPVIPIYFANNAYMRAPQLKNVLITSIGNIDFRYAYFTSD